MDLIRPHISRMAICGAVVFGIFLLAAGLEGFLWTIAELDPTPNRLAGGIVALLGLLMLVAISVPLLGASIFFAVGALRRISASKGQLCGKVLAISVLTGSILFWMLFLTMYFYIKFHR